MTKPGSESMPDWGAGHYEHTAQLLLPAARLLMAAAAPRAGERLLDLGAGTGNAALLAAEAGAEVTAVDPSRRLLAVAATDAQQRGLALDCAIGEASAIPLEDRSFDCVVSNFGLIFAPDPRAAVAEIARVLRPGGRVAFTAWLPGGALGAFSAAAQDMVRSAVGAPAAPPGFAWHEESAVRELFRPHGMSAEARGPYELVFTAASPSAYLDAELRNHPLAVQGFEVLRRTGQAEQAGERLLEVLNEHNEETDGFRSTSRYVVFVAEPR